MNKSSSDLRIENILIQVRAKLNENGVKLWMSPYYEDVLGPCEIELENIANMYSIQLGIPKDQCLAAIHELQNNAIDKLQSRKEFDETGVATLKVRVPDQPGGTKLLTIKQDISATGWDLKENISNQLKINLSTLKLISSGKVVRDNDVLSNQNISYHHQILALVLPPGSDDTVTEDKIYQQLIKTREDAEMLMNGKTNVLQMEDQSGNAVHLPPNVKRSLIMALALHEKGKVELNKENFKEALIYFLEADQEYAQCEQKWLDAVDNYAILNLDIVWCYLCLKSIMQLPDAERRLNLCEQNFKKSYGANLNRVIELKGSSGNEKALIMRLHLLQAVVYFHQNRRNEAQAMLSVAETELNGLKINEGSLNLLMEMGYTSAESRIGLRASGGDINEAITYITHTRDQRSEARHKAKKEKQLETFLTNNNKTDENWVNPRNLHVLTDMGFSKTLCVLALKKSKNDISTAIQLLNDNRDELIKDLTISKDNMQELEKMGFDPALIKLALTSSDDNLSDAIDFLFKLQNDGTYDSMLQNLLSNPNIAEIAKIIEQAPGPSSGSRSETVEALKQKKILEIEKEAEAYERFSEGLDSEDDKYLDLPLVKEEDLLTEYKRYLNV